ncbi:hypothetical protein [Aquirufa novilacunae]|jgi:hypothetical protein|uniref:Outer membrane protein beta-barrel domain-containing protein n=1 Tax=Aquirufa novilacunae TaxID=3139305 RepID=A0ABW8U0P1_9BACT
MKRILLLLLISFSSLAQSYKLEVGSNITSFVFTNSAGSNPSFLRPASGLHMSLSRESKLSKSFLVDYGVNYNQFNNVGDVQNIPFSYATDFIGLGAGIGPRLSLGKGIALVSKLQVAASTLVNGNQFLLNRYVDLSSDSQFSSLRTMYGYSFEISKQINPQIGVFAKYQHLDSYNFGSSTLNFIPSTFSIGTSLSK